MKTYILFCCALLNALVAFACDKDTTTTYHLPDSVDAIQFMAHLTVNYSSNKKEVRAGIRTDVVELYLETEKSEKEVVFEFPKNAMVVATGLNVDTKEKGEITFDYPWMPGENYKLMISVATDSAKNFSLYSGYAWLPKENKWKLLGTCRISGRWNMLQQPASFFTLNKKQDVSASFNEVWCQRSTGSWKNMLPSNNATTPQVNLFSHIDSLAQRQAETPAIIQKLSLSGESPNVIDGVYYQMIKEGTGRQVTVNDTVTVYYKVTLFSDGSLVDEAKDKPATFPLKRLIRGWQLGVPLCKIGCKIKLIIPSDLAYSIRTRSADIPPNSILVFEIEVLDSKSPR